MNKRPMLLMSIVERDNGKKLIEELKKNNIPVNFQCVGYGTAPTEMLDIFGLGSRDKDIVLSLGTETVVKDMMANFGSKFESHSKYGGLMMIFKITAVNRILAEVLSFNKEINSDGGNGAMKNEHHNNLIIISVNEGYSGDVMQVARKAGATGGTVIKGRLADVEQFVPVAKDELDGERELICILAPLETGKRIMEDVNREFGINSVAKGITFALPTEKAYKI